MGVYYNIMFIHLLQSIVTKFYKYTGFIRSKAYNIYLIYKRKKIIFLCNCSLYAPLLQQHLMDKSNAFYAGPFDIGVNRFFDLAVQ